jgi:phosphoglucosamine mutase
VSLEFGTDGIRGVANRDLTPELVLALGRAAARALGTDAPFLIARDTRLSGPLLESTLVAGIAAEGGAVELLGVLPTPGLAGACAAAATPGAMISASHNPFPDNGVKLFERGGRKLRDETESRIEAGLRELLAGSGSDAAAHPARDGRAVGSVTSADDAGAAYVDRLVAAVGGDSPLQGLRLVVDCGHGAASEVAPRALTVLGAEVEVLNAAPDGTNINDGCGSTHPEVAARAVLASGADAGLAFDGDADRVIAIDELGQIVDGDHALAIAAIDLQARGRLRHDAIATTVMANLGLRRALEQRGITVYETPVGDRHVLAAMEEHDLVLGGEQSGHVIFGDHAVTGDGPLTGILLLEAVTRAGRPLSKLAGVVTKFPQVLANVRVERPEGLDASAPVADTVRSVEAELGNDGRVLVRRSGTEPVVRVMVEAADARRAEASVRRLEEVITRELGART